MYGLQRDLGQTPSRVRIGRLSEVRTGGQGWLACRLYPATGLPWLTFGEPPHLVQHPQDPQIVLSGLARKSFRGRHAACRWGRAWVVVGVDAVEQVVEVGAGELPVEGCGDGVVAGLERGQPFADLVEVGEVVGGQRPCVGRRRSRSRPGPARRRARVGGSGGRSARPGSSGRSRPDRGARSRCPRSRTPGPRWRRARRSSPGRPAGRTVRSRWCPRSGRSPGRGARPRPPGRPARRRGGSRARPAWRGPCPGARVGWQRQRAWMEVFSSAQITKSSRPQRLGRPRSRRTGPARGRP